MGSKFGAAVLVTVAAVGVAGSPVAATSGSFKDLSTTGAAFTSNTYRFDPWPCTSACVSGSWSGFNYWGTLKDTSADSSSVFVHAKIDGYGYASKVTLTSGNGNTKSVGQRVYSGEPAQTGWVQVCRDRNLQPDNCATSSAIGR